jgi:hypothetical protein
MESRLRLLVFLAALQCLGCSPPPTTTTEQQPPTQRLASEVQSRMAADPIPDVSKIGARDYTATLELRDFDMERDIDRHHGLYGAEKKRVVKRLHLSWKGEEMYVPMGAYADLSNVNTFEIESADDDAIIRVSGGDASESYRCRIVLKSGGVVSRHLENGEFPEHDSETTSYTNVMPDN